MSQQVNVVNQYGGRRWLRRALRGSLILAVLAAIGWWALPFTVSLPNKLLQPQPVSPTFLAADGTPLRQLLSAEGQRAAAPVAYAEIPEMLVHALLAAEDKRFFSHGGVDMMAISRAAWDNLMSRRVVSGASTLTQQLIKISADERAPRLFWTKLTEALQARRLEMSWDKEQILAAYLNRVNFGNLLTGCSSAAQGYFQKPLRDISPAECALLAALPQSPSRLNPHRELAAVRKRQKRILSRMHELGWLDEESTQLALAEKPKLHRFTGGFAAPHAIALMGGSQMKSAAAGRDADAPIQTTIMPALQSRVEGIIDRRLSLLAAKHVTQAAAVVIENRTGRVLALAGSRDFFAGQGGQINGAWTPHSPGSALKPFTYILALQQGYTAASIIPDLPIEYATATGLYRPENYDRRTHGPVTLRTALASSLNIPAVRVLQSIGREKVLLQSLCDLGLTTLDQPPEHYGLGLTIGNAPVRLLELANAYACLARLGEARPWTLLREAEATQGVPRFPVMQSYVMADILSDNQARLLTFGPHSVIRLPFKCAVKTGTSTNYRDNWTLGFTPEYTVAVWAGNFDNTPMNQVSGVTGAGPIFRDIFKHLHETYGTSWYVEPKGLAHAVIDPRNGKSIAAGDPLPRVTRQELFLPGSVPPRAIPADYETDTGRAFLPAEYTAWVEQGKHWLTGLVTIRPFVADQARPRIVTPTSGSVFVLDPDLRANGQRLLLRASVAGTFRWTSPTLEISEENGQSYAHLIPGQHQLTLSNPATEEAVTVSFEVRNPPTLAEQLQRAAKGRR
ncbi:MAG: penicillin-binding protein 1C [Chthoniobacteraceae bacterium]